MKKTLAAIATAVLIACVSPTPMPTPTPIVEPTKKVELLERKLMGIRIITNGNIYVIGLAYDTDNNNVPDTFEAYLAEYNDQTNWLHLYDLIEITYRTSGDEL